jgi:hypothetical protein
MAARLLAMARHRLGRLGKQPITVHGARRERDQSFQASDAPRRQAHARGPSVPVCRHQGQRDAWRLTAGPAAGRGPVSLRRQAPPVVGRCRRRALDEATATANLPSTIPARGVSPSRTLRPRHGQPPGDGYRCRRAIGSGFSLPHARRHHAARTSARYTPPSRPPRPLANRTRPGWLRSGGAYAVDTLRPRGRTRSENHQISIFLHILILHPGLVDLGQLRRAAPG